MLGGARARLNMRIRIQFTGTSRYACVSWQVLSSDMNPKSGNCTVCGQGFSGSEARYPNAMISPRSVMAVACSNLMPGRPTS